MSRILDPKVDEVDIGSAEKTFTADLTVDRTVLSQGENAEVHGVTVSNSSNKPAEVTFEDSTTKLKFLQTVASRDSKTSPIRFTTSGGLVVKAIPASQASDIFVSVFYSPVALI